MPPLFIARDYALGTYFPSLHQHKLTWSNRPSPAGPHKRVVKLLRPASGWSLGRFAYDSHVLIMVSPERIRLSFLLFWFGRSALARRFMRGVFTSWIKTKKSEENTIHNVNTQHVTELKDLKNHYLW